MKLKETRKLRFSIYLSHVQEIMSKRQQYLKKTNADLYINWNSHAPIQWKRGTFKNLIQRSILICSNEKLLEDELTSLRSVFIKVNDHPSKLVNSIIKTEL